jgi:ferrous iron transport protein A
MNLRELKVGQKAKVQEINVAGVAKKRMMDMGLTKGTEVEVIGIAPLGDPIEISLRGYKLSIRKNEAENIVLAR